MPTTRRRNLRVRARGNIQIIQIRGRVPLRTIRRELVEELGVLRRLVPVRATEDLSLRRQSKR